MDKLQLLDCQNKEEEQKELARSPGIYVPVAAAGENLESAAESFDLLHRDRLLIVSHADKGQMLVGF